MIGDADAGILHPCVILEHRISAAERHWDLLISRIAAPPPDPEARTLAAWRCDAQPGRAEAFQARQLQDHRGRYLTFEGELTGNRGRVDRVACGGAAVVRHSMPHSHGQPAGSAAILVLVLRLDDGTIRYRGPTTSNGITDFHLCRESGHP